MFARISFLLAVAVPLCAQQDEVSRYLEERRAHVADSRAHNDAQRELVKTLAAQIEHSDSEQRVALYLRIGRIEQAVGDRDAAVDAIRRAHELRPLDREVSLAFAEALLASGQIGQADGLLGVDLTDGAALMHRAQELVTGYPTAAARCASLAHQLLPGDASVNDDLGMILMWGGDSSSAAMAFRQAVAQAPLVSLYHYHFGLASSQNNGREAAKAEFLLALELSPLDDERAAIRSALTRLEQPK
jgi:tetratricopeptide (TPR) repeat protein